MTNDGMLEDNMLNSDFLSNTQKCIVIIHKICRKVSILSSTFVDHDVLKLPGKSANTTNRLLLALIICYIIFSFVASILGIWIVTSGLAFGSVGNQGTCKSKGLFTMFKIGDSPCYTATVALTYILQVRNGWSEEKL